MGRVVGATDGACSTSQQRNRSTSAGLIQYLEPPKGGAGTDPCGRAGAEAPLVNLDDVAGTVGAGTEAVVSHNLCGRDTAAQDPPERRVVEPEVFDVAVEVRVTAALGPARAGSTPSALLQQ